jgi:hypothetical protein
MTIILWNGKLLVFNNIKSDSQFLTVRCVLMAAAVFCRNESDIVLIPCFKLLKFMRINYTSIKYQIKIHQSCF